MMTRKTLQRLLSLLLAALLLSALAPAAFAAEVNVVTDDTLDSELVGAWFCYDQSIYGTKLNKLLGFEAILPNGAVLNRADLAAFSEYGWEFPTYTMRDGKTDIDEKLPAAILEAAERMKADGIQLEKKYELSTILSVAADEKALAELQKLSNLVVRYEIFDYLPSKADYTEDDEFYKTATGDGLRLIITADYHENPLTTKKIEYTIGYRFDYTSLNHFFDLLLFGDWTDQNGNAWSFRYAKSESGGYEDQFGFTTPGGELYSGRSWRLSAEEDSAVFEMFFEGGMSAEYKIESLAADVITLRADTGDLILTRVKESH